MKFINFLQKLNIVKISQNINIEIIDNHKAYRMFGIDSNFKIMEVANRPGNYNLINNNPFFYKDRNATERRLVAIAEDSGLRFALDRISVIPSAAVLAREIALLNYGGRNPQKVESAQSNLVISIAETMTDWGLNPTVGLEEVEQ